MWDGINKQTAWFAFPWGKVPPVGTLEGDEGNANVLRRS